MNGFLRGSLLAVLSGIALALPDVAAVADEQQSAGRLGADRRRAAFGRVAGSLCGCVQQHRPGFQSMGAGEDVKSYWEGSERRRVM